MAEELQPQAEEAQPEEKTKGPSKKKRAAIILIIFLVIACFFGVRWWISSKIRVSTDDAFIDGHVFSISARVPGHVSSVLVNDNQMVKKGDMLVELDPADYIAKVQDAAQAVTLARNQSTSYIARAGSAKANVNLAKSRLALAEKNLIRGKELFGRGIIAKQDLDTLEATEKESAAQLNDAEDTLKNAEATAGFLVKGGREAIVAQREAELQQAKLNLLYTKIYAPEDGYVTQKSVEPGNNVQPGQPLMALTELEDPWVT
ncbi:MAG: biotin/lipoyl-binding protein, partial [Nitrospirota bacterium]